jgi:hypothetical protein
MQNGHFDVPDRLFSSIPRTFMHNTTQLSEVKELTPEWFTTPEMFRNINNFDFGVMQVQLTFSVEVNKINSTLIRTASGSETLNFRHGQSQQKNLFDSTVRHWKVNMCLSICMSGLI